MKLKNIIHTIQKKIQKSIPDSIMLFFSKTFTKTLRNGETSFKKRIKVEVENFERSMIRTKNISAQMKFLMVAVRNNFFAKQFNLEKPRHTVMKKKNQKLLRLQCF